MSDKNFKLADFNERQAALNPAKSFIVEAPAGSGKTELLTQRFLALLATVQNGPEQVLAITFTRKAAGEMRQRIINALKNASEPVADETKLSQHELTTRNLAKKALKHAESKSWDILHQTQRLSVMTLDSLSVQISRFQPMASQLGAQASICDEPYDLYQEAVLNMLHDIPSIDNKSKNKQETVQQETEQPHISAIRNLVISWDNDWTKVVRLFTSMLAIRDQWLSPILNRQTSESLIDSLRQSHAAMSLEVIDDVLLAFDSSGLSLTDEVSKIKHLAEFALSFIDDELLLKNINLILNNTDEDLAFWQGVSGWLLTKTETFRKTVTQKQGFPAVSKACNDFDKQNFTRQKKLMVELLKSWSSFDGILDSLLSCQRMPYSVESALESLSDIFIVLPRLVAELMWVFARRGQMDFIEMSTRAICALGNELTPEDALLHFDSAVSHILVDEFQDTSRTQYRLLESLTSGWQVDDGRTLFLVGDPMQSIYRFRQAEVGLFLQVQSHGLGEKVLTPLSLKVNFRASKAIVDWTNSVFSKVMAEKDDICTSKIAYRQAYVKPQESVNNPDINIPVELLAYEKDFEEAKLICEQIKNYWAKGCGSVAILVRSRGQLKYILPLLKENNIPYHAHDIEFMAECSVVFDAWQLTQALCQPYNELAFYGVFRSPCLGLTTGEMHAVSKYHGSPIQQLRLWSDNISSNDSILFNRIKDVCYILEKALQARGQQPLSVWVYETWLALGNSIRHDNSNDDEALKKYFSWLTAFDADDAWDIERMTRQFSLLTVDRLTDENQAVDVMTIHKSKGLEFDAVILPALHQRSRNSEESMLLYEYWPDGNGDWHWLVAPNGIKDSYFDFLKNLNFIKSNQERKRLLYVAVTRARNFISFLANVEKNTANNFLSDLPDFVLSEFENNVAFDVINNEVIKTKSSDLTDISLKGVFSFWPDYDVNQILNYNNIAKNNPIEPEHYKWHHSIEAKWGTVLHECLAFMARDQDCLYESISIAKSSGYLQRLNKFAALRLKQLGCFNDDLNAGVNIIAKAIEKTINSTVGQWLLSNKHTNQGIEQSCGVINNGQVKNYVCDRYFVNHDNPNEYWIIDYKLFFAEINKHKQTNSAKSDLFKLAKDTYEKQLSRYAKLFSPNTFVANGSNQKYEVKLGIYLPLIGELHSWSYCVDDVLEKV